MEGFWKASRELLEGCNGWAEEVGTLLEKGGGGGSDLYTIRWII